MVWTDATEAGILERNKRCDCGHLKRNYTPYIKAHAEFIEIGSGVLQRLQQGVELSLKAA
jgi:hypothetical protein